MSKDEIALELTKLSYPYVIKNENVKGNYNAREIVADLYNHIFTNIPDPAQNKQ